MPRCISSIARFWASLGSWVVGLWVRGYVGCCFRLLRCSCARCVALGCCSRRFRFSVFPAISPLPPLVASGCCQSVAPGGSVAPGVCGFVGCCSRVFRGSCGCFVALYCCSRLPRYSFAPVVSPLLPVVAPGCSAVPSLPGVAPVRSVAPVGAQLARSLLFLCFCGPLFSCSRLLVPVVSSVDPDTNNKKKTTHKIRRTKNDAQKTEKKG